MQFQQRFHLFGSKWIRRQRNCSLFLGHQRTKWIKLRAFCIEIVVGRGKACTRRQNFLRTIVYIVFNWSNISPSIIKIEYKGFMSGFIFQGFSAFACFKRINCVRYFPHARFQQLIVDKTPSDTEHWRHKCKALALL